MNFPVKKRINGRSMYPSSHMIWKRKTCAYSANAYMIPMRTGHFVFLSSVFVETNMHMKAEARLSLDTMIVMMTASICVTSTNR